MTDYSVQIVGVQGFRVRESDGYINLKDTKWGWFNEPTAHFEVSYGKKWLEHCCKALNLTKKQLIQGDWYHPYLVLQFGGSVDPEQRFALYDAIAKWYFSKGQQLPNVPIPKVAPRFK